MANYIILLILTLSCTLAGNVYPTDEESAKELFRLWRNDHTKDYSNGESEQKHFLAFKYNLHLINDLNKRHREETRFAINQFGDMSQEEFRSRILMPKRSPAIFPAERYIDDSATDPLPESFDWRNRSVVTSVKDQGDTGTCWAFSTIGNLEGQWALLGKPLISLSVEQVVDCDGGRDNKSKRADCGVFGGWPYLAYQYVQRVGGIEREEDYKYCCGLGGGPGTCFTCPPPDYNKTLCGPPVSYCLKNESCEAKLNTTKFVSGLQVVDWKTISENETVMADQLMKIGPLSVAFDASLLQFYHSGVFNPPFCNPKDLDHAVLIVGFGVEKGLFEKKPFWIVKNSWGAKWGQKGYFYIKRGAGTCGINTQVTTAVLRAL